MDDGFVISRIIKLKVIYWDLDYLGCHKNRIWHYTFFEENNDTHCAPLQGTWNDIVIGIIMHWAQPTDLSQLSAKSAVGYLIIDCTKGLI